MIRVTPEGKIGLLPMESAGIRTMEVWTHVLEEMALRHGPYPNGFTREILHSEPFPDFAGELATKAARVIASKGLKSEEVFIKFGKTMHMQALFERGVLRIQPASYYAVSDHNGAIRDDELSLPISLAISRDDIVRIVLNPEDVPEGPLEHRADVTYKAGTDYWLYCVTSAVEPRLFVDFQADSCVIVKDLQRFKDLLASQSASSFPNAARFHGKVLYVDPLLPASPVIDVPMSKHFRYEYQREFRFVWKPLVPTANLSYVDLEIGSLKEIAELIVL
jgi:hypothetical protein